MSMVALAFVVAVAMIFLAYPRALMRTLLGIVAFAVAVPVLVLFGVQLVDLMRTHGTDPMVVIVTALGITAWAVVYWDSRSMKK